MPRDGSGASHNVVEAGDHLIHGAGGNNDTAASGVDRSGKAAPHPEIEKGQAMEGMNASGGGSSGAHIGDMGSGKGPKDPHVTEEAKK